MKTPLDPRSAWLLLPFLLAPARTRGENAPRAPAAAPAAAAGWQPRGLFGGIIDQIDVSPGYETDGTLFVTGIRGEIFRSTDRALNWTRILVDDNYGSIDPGHLILSPAYLHGGGSPAQRTLFVIFNTSVYMSTDGGDTFAPRNNGLPCVYTPCRPNVFGLAVSPEYASNQTLWAMVTETVSFSPVFRLFTSTDAGANWSLVGSPPGLSVNDFGSNLVPSPAVTTDQTLLYISGGKFLRSINGGATWTQTFTWPFAGYFTYLAVSPEFATDGAIILKGWNGSTNRVFRSLDRGLTFAEILGQPFGHGDPVFVRRTGQTPSLWIKASSPSGSLLRSDTLGASWTVVAGKDNVEGRLWYTALAASGVLADGEVDLFSGTHRGLFASYDTGLTFDERDYGLSAVEHFSMAGGPGVTISGANYGTWYRSFDAGESWSKFTLPAPYNSNFTSYVAGVSPDYANSPLLFLAGQALLRSTTGGQTFAAQLTPAVPSQIESLAFAPGFNAVNGRMAVAGYGGLFESVNGGQSFTRRAVPVACDDSAAGTVTHAAYSPDYANDATLFIRGYVNSGFRVACRSGDGGASWSRMMNGAAVLYGLVFPSPNFSAGPTPAGTLLFAGSTYLRSVDNGANWTTAAGLSGVVDKFVYSPNFVLDQTVFAINVSGAQAGIYRSADGGASFARIGPPDQLKTRQVMALHLDAGFDGRNVSGAIAVAATASNGMWRSTDGGRSFYPVGKYRQVSERLNGLARASDGKLYAASADQAVFVSTDNGVSFNYFADGLPYAANVTAIAAQAGWPATPVAALPGAGLWRHNGVQWSPIPGYTSGNYRRFGEDANYLYAIRADGLSLRSANGGGSWTALEPAQSDLAAIDFNAQSGPTLNEPRASFAGPRIPDAPAGASASLWAVSQSAGPRWSVNSGATWTATPGTNDYTLPGGQTWTIVRPLGINPVSNAREVVAGSTSGLWLTRDGGDTWRKVSGPGSGLEATSLNFSAVISAPTASGGTDLLVGASGTTTGGVYLSGDGGEHWTQVNQGFDPAQLSIATLAKSSCSGCPVQYYSGSYGGGLYTRTIAVVPPPTLAVNYACWGSTGCTCAATPGSGPVNGGQAFKLCGSNFQNGLVVEFDGIPASGCAQSGGTTITCTGTPPHVAGYASVRVRNPDTRVGFLPAQYQFTGGTSRTANSLRVAKSGANANLTWACTGCSGGAPGWLFRAQNAGFTLHQEQTNVGAASAYTNTGAISTAQSYFWSVE